MQWSAGRFECRWSPSYGQVFGRITGNRQAGKGILDVSAELCSSAPCRVSVLALASTAVGIIRRAERTGSEGMNGGQRGGRGVGADEVIHACGERPAPEGGVADRDVQGGQRGAGVGFARSVVSCGDGQGGVWAVVLG